MGNIIIYNNTKNVEVVKEAEDDLEDVDEKKPAELKTLSQAQNLLQKASDEISGLRGEVKSMSDEVGELRKKADKYDKIKHLEKAEAIEYLLALRRSLGLGSMKDDMIQFTELKKISLKEIEALIANLDRLELAKKEKPKKKAKKKKR